MAGFEEAQTDQQHKQRKDPVGPAIPPLQKKEVKAKQETLYRPQQTSRKDPEFRISKHNLNDPFPNKWLPLSGDVLLLSFIFDFPKSIGKIASKLTI